mmetsp:Transcript_37014/g.33278  ORF Transcript_37014/g.33278 Transcript_37014/m.33278 type:complete len:402 (+) Transcript_37014:58-1263(+)
MRTYLFIFALVLISSASAFKTRRTMGTMLAQVRSMMNSQGPASDVFGLLDQMVAEVKDEQGEHDALRAKQQAQCQQEFDFRNSEIEEAQRAQQAAAEHKEVCSASRENDLANIETNLNNQKQTQETLNRIAAQRQKEAAAYAARVKQHAAAIQAINEAEEYLDLLAAGQASFVQVSAAATNLIKKGVELGKTAAFAPAVVAFTQLAAKDEPTTYFDSDAVERVRELFEKVRDEVNDAFDSYTTQEENAIAAYQEMKALLEKHLSDLIADEATLRAHLDEMNRCIKQETQIYNDAVAKENRNTGLLNDATSLCQHQEESYQQATLARADELRVIAELRGIVEKRYKQFSKHVAHRADVDEFKAHENASEYAGDNYNKQGGEFNAAGAASANYERNEELERFL